MFELLYRQRTCVFIHLEVLPYNRFVHKEINKKTLVGNKVHSLASNILRFIFLTYNPIAFPVPSKKYSNFKCFFLSLEVLLDFALYRK